MTTMRVPRSVIAGGVARAGPLIIEDEWSTTIVPPGWICRSDRVGNLFITPVEVGDEC